MKTVEHTENVEDAVARYVAGFAHLVLILLLLSLLVLTNTLFVDNCRIF